MLKDLAQVQDWIAGHCHRDYYATRYRQMEADYLPQLCEALQNVPPARMVEVGPGWGTMALWLAARGWDVTLVDVMAPGCFITPETLQAMREVTGRPIPYVQHDVCAGPLADRFDLVLMTQVIPHLKWRADAAVRAAAAMTSDVGRLVATALDKAAYPHLTPAYPDWRDVPAYGVGDPTPAMVVAMYDADSLRDLLDCGFDAIEIHRPHGSTCLLAVCRDPIPVSSAESADPRQP